MASINIPNEVFSIWVPLAITLVIGFVGVLRGALRETVVAAAVVLGAFICTQWASPWAAEIKDVFPQLDQQQTQFYLGLLIFWLIVLALGYGLGGLLPTVAVTTPSRMLGGVLGLMSGAAAAGWSLRFSITNPDMTLQDVALLHDPFSRGFMIWAGWFPLALALLGTVAVIVGPLRRAQRAVGQPSPSTEWTPASAAPAATPSVGAGYGAAAAGTGAVMYGASRASEPSSNSYYGGSYGPPPPYRPDSPATAPLPVRSTAPDDTPNTGGPPASARVSTPDTGTYDSAAATTPSWMLPPEPPNETPAPAPDEVAKATEPAPQAEAASSSSETTPEQVEQVEGQATCPNCGGSVVPGATFCTQCGTRLQAGAG